MNKLLKGMKKESNYTLTENGALTHTTTNSALLDLFAMGGACRSRNDEDKVLLFKKAFEENPHYAMKCLFYLRDRMEGQGERDFFRTCIKFLGNYNPQAILVNLDNIPEFGRYDDYYALVGTDVEHEAIGCITTQLKKDIMALHEDNNANVSLAAKWAKSENCSNKGSRKLGTLTRNALGLSSRDYRHLLTTLRNRINIVETLMSSKRFDEIEFDKLPSRASFIYRKAFMNNSKTSEKYRAFIEDKTTKVKSCMLYPYEIVNKAYLYTIKVENNRPCKLDINDIERVAINKYWDNLKDYFNGKSLNALAMIDTSGSMSGTPINVAISLGLYCAERCGGPFKNHYISFSRTPKLIECDGIDFVDKVQRIYSKNLCENTNIEAAFDMILQVALSENLTQQDLPENIIVVSDMEFDRGVVSVCDYDDYYYTNTSSSYSTLIEEIKKKWKLNGYKMPKLIYWNVCSRQNNIPSLGGDISYVSGFSPTIFETILSGKTGFDLMKEKLDSPRYQSIR